MDNTLSLQIRKNYVFLCVELDGQNYTIRAQRVKKDVLCVVDEGGYRVAQFTMDSSDRDPRDVLKVALLVFDKRQPPSFISEEEKNRAFQRIVTKLRN